MTWGDQRACIDVDLAPLVFWMWQHDLVTRYSCQDSSGRADVSFYSGDDLERAYGLLLDVVDRDPDACLSHRARRATTIFEGLNPEAHHRHSDESCWDFEVWPRLHVIGHDDRMFAEDARHPGLLNYRLSMPATDLSAVTRLLVVAP